MHEFFDIISRRALSSNVNGSARWCRIERPREAFIKCHLGCILCEYLRWDDTWVASVRWGQVRRRRGRGGQTCKDLSPPVSDNSHRAALQSLTCSAELWTHDRWIIDLVQARWALSCATERRSSLKGEQHSEYSPVPSDSCHQHGLYAYKNPLFFAVFVYAPTAAEMLLRDIQKSAYPRRKLTIGRLRLKKRKIRLVRKEDYFFNNFKSFSAPRFSSALLNIAI